jgi:hypothetical protein
VINVLFYRKEGIKMSKKVERPMLYLYIDSKQKESVEAQEILHNAGIQVDIWDLQKSAGADFEPPLLIASEPVFRTYSTLTEISSFTRMYKTFLQNGKT